MFSLYALQCYYFDKHDLHGKNNGREKVIQLLKNIICCDHRDKLETSVFLVTSLNVTEHLQTLTKTGERCFWWEVGTKCFHMLFQKLYLSFKVEPEKKKKCTKINREKLHYSAAVC